MLIPAHDFKCLLPQTPGSRVSSPTTPTHFVPRPEIWRDAVGRVKVKSAPSGSLGESPESSSWMPIPFPSLVLRVAPCRREMPRPPEATVWFRETHRSNMGLPLVSPPSVPRPKVASRHAQTVVASFISDLLPSRRGSWSSMPKSSVLLAANVTCAARRPSRDVRDGRFPSLVIDVR